MDNPNAVYTKVVKGKLLKFSDFDSTNSEIVISIDSMCDKFRIPAMLVKPTKLALVFEVGKLAGLLANLMDVSPDDLNANVSFHIEKIRDTSEYI